MGEFPNKATQFTSENQPPNEAKRVPKTKTIKRIIREIWVDELVDDGANGKVSRAVKGIKAIIREVEKGNVPAFNALVDRLEGKPKQTIDQTTDGIQKVVVEYVESSQLKSDECIPPEQGSDDAPCGESGRIAVE